MCGRFTLDTAAETIAKVFDLPIAHDLTPRNNIAPTQQIAIIRQVEGKRELVMVRWGLVPSWAKDLAIGQKLFNARAETIKEKPAFRAAFRQRRCIIPADGFYEWKNVSGRKQPYHIRFCDRRPFAIAGLWEQWTDSDGQTIPSCTLITTESNDLVATLHNRMPVILPSDIWQNWLSPREGHPERLQRLLIPFPDDEMEAFPASPSLNRPA